MNPRLQSFLAPLTAAYCWSSLAVVTASFYTLARGLDLAGFRRAWDPLLHRWARACMALGPFTCTVDGAGRGAGPAVIAANHQSALDVAILAAILPPPVCFVARRDLACVPIVGSVLRRGGHVLVRPRAAPGSRGVRRALEVLDRGGRVVFFAEGSRSPDGGIRPFRSGAFRLAALSGRPLVPVAIEGSRLAIAKGTRAIRPCRVAVSFLEPLAVERHQADRPAFREQVRIGVAREVSRRRGSVEGRPAAAAWAGAQPAGAGGGLAPDAADGP